MRDLLIFLGAENGQPLKERLRAALVEAILGQSIPQDSSLPSPRLLARQLGVARNTVMFAYQELVADGFLIAKPRQGYYVNGDILAGRTVRPQHSQLQQLAPGVEWSRRFRMLATAQRNITKASGWQNFAYPFIYGQFDWDLFPIAEWRECSRQALSRESIRAWARDSFVDDDPLFVEQIRTHLLPRRGISASPDEILVTLGAQQAIHILATLLVGETTRVGVEDPGYTDARNIFALRTSRIEPLLVDERGLKTDSKVDSCDYVYVTPSHQFPTTVTLSLERRLWLLERAAASDFVVIEDDYEHEIRFFGPPIPALKSIDRGGRVIYISSLSKSLAPGLRLGYMVGPCDLIREARALRRLMVRHPPANNQRAAALFLKRGHHESLMRRLCHSYQERWLAMSAALDCYLPECRYLSTSGGSACWILCPPEVDTRRLEREAALQGVLIEPGDYYFAGKAPPLYCMRLGFSSIARDRIEAGIKLLAPLIRGQRHA